MARLVLLLQRPTPLSFPQNATPRGLPIPPHTGTIGITDYASKALGDVVYVELPAIDLKVSKGDNIGAVESVKSASDIMTPVSGKITDTNALLEEKPATINKGPEGEGWLAKIEVDDAKELDALMTKQQYDQHAEGGEESE
jgi:glycine cleavage system H protein